MAGDRGSKFVILSSQRSGSTWLVSLLDKLEDTQVYAELFLPRKRKWDAGSIDYPRFVDASPRGLAVRPWSVFSYLDGLYQRPGAIGFKLMYGQLMHYPEILAYFVTHRIRVVHLVRENHLDVVISGAIRTKTGQAHRLSGKPEPGSIQVELNPETLKDRLKTLRRNIMTVRKLLRWSRLPHIEVVYEELVRDPSRFSLIWDFLSINPEGQLPQSDLVKIRRGRYAEVISNYDEVKTALAGSVFAGLIEEKA